MTDLMDCTELVGTVANNGNLLLNIGPKADGTIPKMQEERLLEIGEWLSINGDAIYGTRCSKRESILGKKGIDIHFTKKEENLYVILDKLPNEGAEVVIPGVYKEGAALHVKSGE